MQRLAVFHQLCTLFPEHATTEIYNRRKPLGVAEDNSVLGYCIVNKLSDTRLGKVWKMVIDSSISDNTEHLLVDNVDLFETCVVRRDSVKDLKAVIITLTCEMKFLKEKVYKNNVYLIKRPY